jgi:hypothetical protein
MRKVLEHRNALRNIYLKAGAEICRRSTVIVTAITYPTRPASEALLLIAVTSPRGLSTLTTNGDLRLSRLRIRVVAGSGGPVLIDCANHCGAGLRTAQGDDHGHIHAHGCPEAAS